MVNQIVLFPLNNKKKLLIIFILTVGYMIAEFIGGYITGSLALTADAGHMLSDTASLGLSLFAISISQKPASPEKTYGYYRAEIIAAFINGLLLSFTALFILYEAYHRFFHMKEILVLPMIIIALGGFFINIIGITLLKSSKDKSINIKGAYLHIIGDLLGSISVLLAGLIMLIWKFQLADLVISVFIACLILFNAIRLINEAVNILLESSPSHINVKDIEKSLMSLSFVEDVHHLHVWAITDNKIALSVHVITSSNDYPRVLHIISRFLNEKYKIGHSTIQLEPISYKFENFNY